MGRYDHGWVTLTHRTNDPKLRYLEGLLDAAELPHRRNGASWHGPILQVLSIDVERAEAILRPIDAIPDDDPRFS